MQAGVTPLAAELRRAMERRGMTNRALSRESGVDYRFVIDLVSGNRRPALATSSALADALDWPAYHEMNVADRTTACEGDGCTATFIRDTDGTSKRRFCSDQCKHRYHSRRLRDSERVQVAARARRAEDEVELLRERIRAMCSACTERTMVCRIPECELREVSPAVLVLE